MDPSKLLSLSTPFIKRPVATALLTIGIFLVGLVAFPQLQVAPLPQVEFPTIQVSASLPGGSPETMASSVATPLENKLGLIPGVAQMTSQSSMGRTSITLQFDLDADIDAAAQEVQSAISLAQRQLPADLPSPPTFRKVNPADSPFMFILMSSEVLPLTQVSDYAENIIAQSVSQLKGVAQVDIMGQHRPAIRVQADPAKLAALGLSMDDVRGVLAEATVNSPKGTIEGARQSFSIYANDQLFDPAPYNDIILAYRGGAPVRVRDVGRAVAGPEDYYTAALVSNSVIVRQSGGAGAKRGVCISIRKQVGANVLENIAQVRAMLPALQAKMPPSVDIDIMDNSRSIKTSVEEVETHLVLTMLLVTLVVFLFLRNVRATLISSAVVPISIVATFAVMYLLGFSLNNISLMALTISVGFVIDDAIVMLENIYRHIEEGMKPFEAALRGAGEIGFTILSISASLVAVFIPVLLMGGIVGRLFREFAVTVTVTVLISGFVSLTFVPMMCSRFLRHHRANGKGTAGAGDADAADADAAPAAAAAAAAGAPAARVRRPLHWALYDLLEGFFAWLENFYAAILRVVLRWRRLTLASLFATIALTVFCFVKMPKGFFPQQDVGFFNVIVDASPDISFEAMHKIVERVADVVRDEPGVQAFQVRIGGGLNAVKNSGRFFVCTTPREERPSVWKIMDNIKRKTAGIPGVTVMTQAKQDVNVGGRMTKTQFQYTLGSADLEELNRWAPRVIERLKKMDTLVLDVASDQEAAAPAVSVVINRQAASRFGITTQAIDAALYNAFGQRQITQFYTQVSQYKVILEVPPSLQRNADTFDKIFLRSPLTGGQVPLSALVTLDTRQPKPLVINHYKQFPAVTISFNLVAGVALGDAVTAIEREVALLGMPDTITAEFQGTAQAFQESLKSMPLLIAAAIVVIYIILGMLYESFIHPLTILSTLPSAGLGALLTLWLVGQDVGVIAIIGILLLIGIVKKNAIMMIDFAIDAERHAGATPYDAIYEACRKRFRPILMTTLAAMLGGVPLALGHGDGSELRQPLGYAIVGGLVLSQALTLFTTPVVYLWFSRFTRHKTAPAAVATEPAAVPVAAS
ncbi:MAG: efflux RND transporter permease subunit [Puniceicoccales bacterium]|jgi:multidrug efflux pump subunit AcrB|nr:efflux RND transporter permease subunit [Puniceicoccales bacterium]